MVTFVDLNEESLDRDSPVGSKPSEMSEIVRQKDKHREMSRDDMKTGSKRYSFFRSRRRLSSDIVIIEGSES